MTAQDSDKGDVSFTAKDVKKIAGLSYRQLNDWTSKGLLDDDREGQEWRTFTPKQMFVLLTCATLREQFGAPLEGLGYVANFMLDEKANHFAWAVEAIANRGYAIYLLTDFRKTFIMESDLEFEIMFRRGVFRSEGHVGYALLHINPLVNAVLEAMGQARVETRGDYYRARAEAQSRAFQFAGDDISENERHLLEVIRRRSDHVVTVHVRGGHITKAYADDSIESASRGLTPEEILTVLEGSDQQTLTISKRQGKVMNLNRRTPVKFPEDEGGTSSGRGGGGHD